MALKNKISILDRNVSGIEGPPVGQNPPSDGNYFTEAGTSDSPFASSDHLVDLLTKNVKSENSGQTYTPSPNKSPFQDLDGVAGPQFQLDQAAASEKHIDSLKQVPGPPSSSPFQDRGDGATPGQYIDNLPG